MVSQPGGREGGSQYLLKRMKSRLILLLLKQRHFGTATPIALGISAWRRLCVESVLHYMVYRYIYTQTHTYLTRRVTV